MWTKTIIIKYKSQKITVLVFLSSSPEDNQEVVKIQSMVNEYYLIEEIVFSSRDAAYDFIKHFPSAMAKAFIIREGYSSSELY